MNIVIPMAGSGERFRAQGYTALKPFIEVDGVPMAYRAIESLKIPGDYFLILSNESIWGDAEKLFDLVEDLPFVNRLNYLFIEKTEGPACTVKKIEKFYIDLQSPLLTANCDQILVWDPEPFLKHISSNIDGCVGVFEMSDIKLEEKSPYSFVKLDSDGFATEFEEKKAISNYALNGIHYWKKTSDFLWSIERAIEKDIRVNGEFYISKTYNELVALGHKFNTFKFNLEQHHDVGTPEGLRKYENLKNQSL